ncbi:hypothetical protein BC830DRAFT_1172257 [Chytriomyces sp. MP71]|nr:hypothetical protein BC830DRAFT_1172257 [Chytriomyces sp. MP71]
MLSSLPTDTVQHLLPWLPLPEQLRLRSTGRALHNLVSQLSPNFLRLPESFVEFDHTATDRKAWPRTLERSLWNQIVSRSISASCIGCERFVFLWAWPRVNSLTEPHESSMPRSTVNMLFSVTRLSFNSIRVSSKLAATFQLVSASHVHSLLAQAISAPKADCARLQVYPSGLQSTPHIIFMSYLAMENLVKSAMTRPAGVEQRLKTWLTQQEAIVEIGFRAGGDTFLVETVQRMVSVDGLFLWTVANVPRVDTLEIDVGEGIAADMSLQRFGFVCGWILDLWNALWMGDADAHTDISGKKYRHRK